MRSKAQKAQERSKPNPRPGKKNEFKSNRSQYSGLELQALVSGPEKKLVEFCRNLILEKRITTRTEFNRFAPKMVKEHVRRNPELWKRVGIPNYHREIRANGLAAWKTYCEATLDGDIQTNATHMKKEASARKKPENPASGRSFGVQNHEPFKGVGHVSAEHVPIIPKEPEFASTPSGSPAPSYLFKKWKSANAEEKKTIKQRLYHAAVSGPVAEICAILDRGVPIDIRDDVGRPFFMFVAERGRAGLLKEILGYMGDVDRRDRKGETVLMACAECGHKECVQMLLKLKGKSKPDLNARNKKKQTAMMLAAWEGHLGIVRSLHNAGANLKLRDNSKRNAEDYARFEGHSDVVAYLRSHR
jgi:hypothetical protein